MQCTPGGRGRPAVDVGATREGPRRRAGSEPNRSDGLRRVRAPRPARACGGPWRAGPPRPERPAPRCAEPRRASSTSRRISPRASRRGAHRRRPSATRRRRRATSTPEPPRPSAAMRQGADVIYQAVARRRPLGRLRGLPRACSAPGHLGDWSYEVLGRQARPGGRRLPPSCSSAPYTEWVGRMQGVEPEHLHVLTGDERAPQPSRLRLLGVLPARQSRLRGDRARRRRAAPTSIRPTPTPSHTARSAGGRRRAARASPSRRSPQPRRRDGPPPDPLARRRDHHRRPVLAVATERRPSAAHGFDSETYERARVTKQSCRSRGDGSRPAALRAPPGGPLMTAATAATYPGPRVSPRFRRRHPDDVFFDLEGDPFARRRARVPVRRGRRSTWTARPVTTRSGAHDRDAAEKTAFEAFIDLVMSASPAPTRTCTSTTTRRTSDRARRLDGHARRPARTRSTTCSAARCSSTSTKWSARAAGLDRVATP